METLTNRDMRGLRASSLDTATVDEYGWQDTGAGPGYKGNFID